MAQEKPDPRPHAVRRMRQIVDPLGYFASEGVRAGAKIPQ